MLKSSTLNEILTGTWIQYAGDFPVSHLSTDSRKIIQNESSLFFAIRGKIHDGHQYIHELYKNHIRQFIVENQDFDLLQYPLANFFLVDNSIRAIQEITAYHRQQFSLKILSVTGSNGKTIVKEWISMILSWKYDVVKSPKSFNSQIGVPLSIWQINETHQYGVFEAGISMVGEMERLEKIIKPDVVILTNLRSAHDEGFSSRSEKLDEKLKLGKNARVLIYNRDNEMVHARVNELLPDIEKITWGSDPGSHYWLKDVLTDDKSGIINILHHKRKYTFSVNFTDQASIENLMHCIVFLLHEGWKIPEIQQGLDALHTVSMRLEMKKGINDCYLIDDTYNNDLAGLEIALNYLGNQNQRSKKSLILSDILQSGMKVKELYQRTAEIINQHSLDKIVGIGHEILQIGKHLHTEFHFFEEVPAFLRDFDFENFNNEIILVKGARNFELERVIRHLQEKIHGTVLEINLDAVSHNLNVYRSYLKPSTRIMVMVKALAYGSGSIEVANLLEFHRIDYLGVAYVDEGVTLRKNGINLPIMIMNPSLDALDKIHEFRLEPEIYSLRLLKEIDQFTRKFNRSIKIHIKLDTGMNRLGFNPEEVGEMIQILQNNNSIVVASVFSHLSSAEDEEQDDFTRQQAQIFLDAAGKIKEKIPDNFLKHIANSAAMIRFPEYHFDMVRLGIGIYGYDATGRLSDRLRSISSLRTEISQIKHLHQGDTVGYGRRGEINQESTVATIAIGYADGFFRAFGNGRTSIWINGRLAPVIGNVCMDMTMIDITGIEAREGDEVIIFDNIQSLKSLADSIHTIPYEILTNISERVKRIYISE